MIAIVNVTPEPKPTGPHTYEVRINRHAVVRFEHAREEGLARCLRRAAEAVEADSLQTLAHMLIVDTEQA